MVETSSGYDLIKQLLAASAPPPSLLFISADAVRRERVVKSIAEKFFGGREVVPCKRWHGKSFGPRDLAELKDELHSLSLFSAQRFALIESSEEIKADYAKELATLLADSSPRSVTLLLTAREMPATNSLRKFFAKEKLLVALDALEGPALEKWARKEFKSLSITHVDESAIEALLAVAEGDLDRLAQLISHTSLYSDGGAISEETVTKLFPEKTSATEYELLDLLALGKKADAEQKLAILMRGGTNPFLLLSLLSRTYLTYRTVRALSDRGVAPVAIREKLKIPPWLLQKHMAAVKNKSAATLDRQLESIVVADSLLKNRSVGPEAVMSELVSRLC